MVPEIALRIGGITIVVTSDEPGPALRVDGAAARFLVAGAAPDVRVATGGVPDVTIVTTWGDLADERRGEPVFDASALWQLDENAGSYRFRFTSPVLGPRPYKVARFNRDFTDGAVILHREYFSQARSVFPLEYPLDELLITNLLARERGVEVHACGVVDPVGRGHLFVGPSGAGKTTMARLWQEWPGVTILSDDRIILRRVGGMMRMYGTPWHGEAGLASPVHARLIEVLFLRHGRRNERVGLGGAEAAARLLACSFPPFYSAAGLGFTLEFCERVTTAVPCQELVFVPDRSAVDFIREAPTRPRWRSPGLAPVR